jgi:hypothetical protein
MRLFLHPVSLVSPHKHRISISSLKIFEKYLRVFAVSIDKHQRPGMLKTCGARNSKLLKPPEMLSQLHAVNRKMQIIMKG